MTAQNPRRGLANSIAKARGADAPEQLQATEQTPRRTADDIPEPDEYELPGDQGKPNDPGLGDKPEPVGGFVPDQAPTPDEQELDEEELDEEESAPTRDEELAELREQVGQLSAALTQALAGIRQGAALAVPNPNAIGHAAPVRKAVLKKLIWIGELWKKGDGEEQVRLEDHTCYLSSPAIHFKPFGVDPEDPRPHAMVPDAFGDYLVNNAFDRRTGAPQFVWADDPSAPNPRAFQYRARAVGSQA